MIGYDLKLVLWHEYDVLRESPKSKIFYLPYGIPRLPRVHAGQHLSQPIESGRLHVPCRKKDTEAVALCPQIVFLSNDLFAPQLC